MAVDAIRVLISNIAAHLQPSLASMSLRREHQSFHSLNSLDFRDHGNDSVMSGIASAYHLVP